MTSNPTPPRPVSETPSDWRTHPLVVAAWPVFDKVIGDVRYARISERDLETICTAIALSRPQGRGDAIEEPHTWGYEVRDGERWVRTKSTFGTRVFIETFIAELRDKGDPCERRPFPLYASLPSGRGDVSAVMHYVGEDQSTACGQWAAHRAASTTDVCQVTCKRCRRSTYFLSVLDGQRREGK